MNAPEGVIIPPPEVREVINKTAGYIHRNGPSFEQRMKERQGQNKQFQFLFENDAYHGYYQWRVSCFKDGTANEGATGDDESNKEQAQSVDEGVIVSEHQQQDTIRAPREPRDLDFHYADLIPMSSFDFDVIKMTASLVAQNGDEYAQKLLKQRQEKISLDFLQESHSLHKIYAHYVAQYRAIITPSESLIQRISAKAQDPHSVLAEAYERAEYLTKLENEEKLKNEEIKQKNLEYASIDWSDFVIVETIDIDDADKVTELPPPLSLADLQYRSLAQKKAHSLLEEAAPDEDLPTYEQPDSDQEQEQEQEQQDEEKSSVSQPVSLPSRPARPVPKGMKIKSVGSSAASARLSPSPSIENGEKMVRSPFSNQMIPESKLKQHIDITLRDPRYAEEKKRYESKVKNTNPTSTDDVLDNIKSVLGRNVNKRAGNNDDDDSNENDNVKRSKTVQWDGYQSSSAYVTNQAQKSVTKKDLQDHKRRAFEKQNKIGPH